MQEAVADKSYCKLETLSDCAVRDLATSYSKPKMNGQRRWDDKPDAGKSAFEANHDRVTSDRVKLTHQPITSPTSLFQRAARPQPTPAE